MHSNLKRRIKTIVLGTARLTGYQQSESKLIADSDAFWKDNNASQFKAYSHWRGEAGIAADAWSELGRQHLNLFHDYQHLLNLHQATNQTIERIVEWGCGGGSNAIHFARIAKEFIGADVSAPTLDECERALRDAGLHNMTKVLIDVASPEQAAASIAPCDLFLCTYVMELVPTPEYGKRVVAIAHQILKPGGLAIIQIKYATTQATTKPRRWGYRHNAANMTTYPIDQFWILTQAVGFQPIAITLKPKQELIGDERYAYFILKK